MFINFISEIIHATKFFKSPNAEIEKLKTENLTVETLNVTDTASVHNKLTVEKDLVVDDKATIKTAEITENAVVKKDLSVEKNLEVKERATIKNASIATANIDDVHKDSKVWLGDVSTLVTDAHEYGLTNQENRNWNGSGTKVSKSNHTHKIPNAIKNPNTLTIYEYSKSAEDHKGRAHAYDGSPCTSGDKMNNDGDTGFVIDYNFVGASPKVHTSTAGNTYGQATDELFGHTKLYTFDASKFLDADGNPDADKTSEYISKVSEMGISSGTALTPASLSAYAQYLNECVLCNFYKKPTGGNDTFDFGNVNVNVGGTLQVGKGVQFGMQGVIYGANTGDSTGIITIYSAGDPKIGKLEFGMGDKAPILTSNNDGHLYIEMGDYRAKLMDYEIETIITSNSSKFAKKWVPSREGFYRIYMIGGSGFGAGAYAETLGADYAPSSGDPHKNGYGWGEVFPGFGGCGAPVVVVDLVTENAPASVSAAARYYSILATCPFSPLRAKATITISGSREGKYTGSINITDINIDGNVVCYPLNTDELIPDNVLYDNVKVKSGKTTILFSDAELPLTVRFNEDKTEVIGGSMTIRAGNALLDGEDDSEDESDGVTVQNVVCSLEGGGSDPDESYLIRSLTFKRISLTIEKKESGSTEGDTSGDISDDNTSDDGLENDNTENSGNDQIADSADPDAEEQDAATGIGVTFTFFKNNAYKITNKGIKGNNRVTCVRSVGANGFSSVGRVLNKINDTPIYLKSSLVDRLGGKTSPCSKYNYDTNDPNANTTEFEVFVGHGYDTWTLSQLTLESKNLSSDPYANEYKDGDTYGRRPRSIEGNGKLYKTANPFGMYGYGDPFADLMVGGSSHHSGVNGWLTRIHVVEPEDYSWNGTMVGKNIKSGVEGYDHEGIHYCMQPGYCGGPPGSVGITGNLPGEFDDGTYVKNHPIGAINTNTTSEYGMVKGKGSAGGFTSVWGFKSVGNIKTLMSVQAGAGASFALSALDNYNGGIQHSDRTTANTMLRYPGFKSKKGGYGYYGGGSGGGGGIIVRTSGTEPCKYKQVKVQVQQNDKSNIHEPCVIIVYMGVHNQKEEKGD